MQLLGFACIRDCENCPFACNRDFNRTARSNNHVNQVLPAMLNNPITEKSISPEKTEAAAEEEKQEKTEITENLPVLAEVQYTIKETEEKKGLFNWRKNK